ncbi:hypothetical protein OAF54_03500 [bacterium]|nr:hypothetical protein [bacterium]
MAVVKRFLRKYRPARVVGLGDWVDATTASRHLACNVQEAAELAVRDLEHDELIPLGLFIDYILKYSGELILHEGNHEHRINSVAANNVFLRSIYSSIAPIMRIKRDRLTWIPYSPPDKALSKYEIMPESDKCSALWSMHGWSHSSNASKSHLDRVHYRVSCVHGHVHRATRTQLYVEPRDQRIIKAWSPGCLAEKRPYYQHGKPGDATHGFTVIYCKNDLTEWKEYHVEIQNGKAVLPNGVQI